MSYTLRALLMTVCIKKPARIIAISLCKYKTILFGAKSCLAFLARVTMPWGSWTVHLLWTCGVQHWSSAQQAVRDPHHMEWRSTPQRAWASLEVVVQMREWERKEFFVYLCSNRVQTAEKASTVAMSSCVSCIFLLQLVDVLFEKAWAFSSPGGIQRSLAPLSSQHIETLWDSLQSQKAYTFPPTSSCWVYLGTKVFVKQQDQENEKEKN